MAMSDKDLQILRALVAARQQHEELADLLDFYRDLYEVQFQAKATGPEPEVRDELAMRWRLEGGIPQLTFEQLRLEPQPFAHLVDQVSETLRRHNPGWEFEREGRSPENLTDLAREVFETWDTLTAPKSGSGRDETGAMWSDHPIALAVGFALGPYLQRAAEVILPQLDLSLWTQNYCPICGGRPNLAVLEEERGARRLMCSRCNGLWNYPRVGCPFCKTKEKQTYYPTKHGVYRLYVCPACRHYLKTIDLRGVYRPVHLPVERLLTVGMDLAAQQQGYES
jgi:formate dehydrogenase maturation protein FdhE